MWVAGFRTVSRPETSGPPRRNLKSESEEENDHSTQSVDQAALHSESVIVHGAKIKRNKPIIWIGYNFVTPPAASPSASRPQ